MSTLFVGVEPTSPLVVDEVDVEVEVEVDVEVDVSIVVVDVDVSSTMVDVLLFGF